MNKYITFGIIFFYMLFITVVVDATDTYTYTGDPDTIITEPSDTDRVTVFSMLGTFIGLLTFSIDGIPPIVNILFIAPLVFVIGYMIIDVLKDLVPFT